MTSGTYFNWSTENVTPLLTPPNAGQPHTSQIGVQRATVPVDWARANGHQVWFTEGGVAIDGDISASDSWEVCLDNTLAYHKSVGVPFTYWTAGPYSGLNYPLGLEPTGTLGNYVDRRQAAVIRKYTGVGWNTGAALFTGPIRGTAGTATRAISLETRGYFTQAQTYTFASTDAQGVFQYNGATVTSITVQPGNGFNQYASIVYVPGPTSIAATLTLGTPSNIVAPAPVGFSTIADPLAAEPTQATNIFAPFLINTAYLGSLGRVYGINETVEANGVNFTPDARIVGGTFTQADVASRLTGISTNVVLASGTQAVTGWRIKLYDQSGLGNDQTLVPTGDNHNGPGGRSSIPGSISDLPILYFDVNGKPNIYYNQSRLVAILRSTARQSSGRLL